MWICSNIALFLQVIFFFFKYMAFKFLYVFLFCLLFIFHNWLVIFDFQSELNEFALVWNTPKIRSWKNGNAPTGRPMCLFELPYLFDASNYLVRIPDLIVDIIKESKDFLGQNNICDEDVVNLWNCIMLENNSTRGIRARTRGSFSYNSVTVH